MPDITLGNYEIDEDSNGNLVIKDKNDTVVFQYDDASSTFQPQVEFDFGSNDISNVGSINTNEIDSNGAVVRGFTRNLNAGEKKQLDPNGPAVEGVYIIKSDANNRTGIVSTEEDNTVDIVAANGITTTEGNSGTINIYYDSTNSRFEIEAATSFSIQSAVLAVPEFTG